jgi:hypothetical protein
MSLSKKVRFEVFKRDSFTCQYCGRSAPDILLEVDHIEPKSKGGADDLLNLVTSCEDCNRGKSNRELTDGTAVKRRKQQLDQLQKKRDQLELLMEWHKSLLDLEEQTITELSEMWTQLTDYELTTSGLDCLKKWVKKFGINEVIESMKISIENYLELDMKEPTRQWSHTSVNKAFDYIPKICVTRKGDIEKPYLKELFYIRGILRNRLSYLPNWEVITFLEQTHLDGIDTEFMKYLAKQTSSWNDFQDTILDRLGIE